MLGLAAAAAAAGILSVGAPISTHYAHRTKPMKIRRKSDRSKKQYLLKGVRP